MPTARVDVVTVLGDISSKDRHYEWYKATGGQGNIAAELWRFWLKDAYLPHSADFQREFTQAEQDQLEMFTQFFEARLKQLPARFESLMTDVQWAGIREYAATVLEHLAGADQESRAR